MLYQDPKRLIKKFFGQFDMEKNEDRVKIKRKIQERLESLSGYEKAESEYILYYLKKTYSNTLNPISSSIFKSSSESPTRKLYKNFYLNFNDSLNRNETIEKTSSQLEKFSDDVPNGGKRFLKDSYLRIRKLADKTGSPATGIMRDDRKQGNEGKIEKGTIDKDEDYMIGKEVVKESTSFSSKSVGKGLSRKLRIEQSQTPRVVSMGKKIKKDSDFDKISMPVYNLPNKKTLFFKASPKSPLKIDESKRISVLIRASNQSNQKKFTNFKLFKLFK